MADTRKDKRAPVSLKVRFKSATVDEFIEHYSKDVSRGGIYIKSSQPMPVGTLLKFQFQLKDESALIRGVGRVVWTRAEEDAQAEQPAGMGIKFIKMDTESRAVVDRIVDSHGPDEGTYVKGREGATHVAVTSSAPPPPESGSFFPDLPPAEQPPPEDRTAVRQVTELLAATLTEASTDESATREAQERAEEARRRTEEIEQERRREAERKRQASDKQSGLPSMIIDPTLSPRGARPSEQRLSEPSVVARPPPRPPTPSVSDDHEPDTEPPAAPPVPATTTTSIPETRSDGGRRGYLPYLVIAALLVIAGVVALRGGPRELPLEAREEPHAEPMAEPTAPPPGPAPTAPAAVAPAEPPPENVPPQPAAAAPTAAAVTTATTKVTIGTNPKGAEVFVGDASRGTAPVTLELTQGVPVVVRARAKGYAEAHEELTPGEKPAAHTLTLSPLVYQVHVESTPAGASVTLGSLRGTAPVDLTLPGAPSGDLPVTAKLTGYDTARSKLSPTAFEQDNGMMRASVSVTLRAHVGAAAKPAPAAREPKAEGAEPSTAPAPREAAEPKEPKEAPEKPAAEKPKPAPEKPKPAPREELPDNPFGD